MSTAGGPGGHAAGRGSKFLRKRLARLRRRITTGIERLFALKWLWSLLFLAALAPLVVGPRFSPALPVPPAGSIATDDIIATSSQEFEDTAATRDLRQAARAVVPPVYDFDSQSADQAVATLEQLFGHGRQLREAAFLRGARAQPDTPEITSALAEKTGFSAPEKSIAHLVGVSFDPAVEARLSATLLEVLGRRVLGSRALLPRSGPVTLHDTRTGRIWREDHSGEALSLDDARRMALQALRDKGAGSREREALSPLLSDLIVPNMIFSGALTEARRQAVADRIEPLIVRVPKGKLLVRQGERVNEETIRTLLAFNGARDLRASGTVFLGNILLLSLLLFFMARYVFYYQKSSQRDRHLFALMVMVMILGLSMDHGFQWLFENVVDSLKVEPFANPTFYRFMVPVATGAMLMTLLVNPRVGMAYALFYVPLFGMARDWDLPLLLFCLLSNLAGIYGITAYRRRSALIKAGFVLGGANAIAVLALQSIAGEQTPVLHLAFQMFCGFAGGVLVAMLVSFLLPLLEDLFNILTDVRLLELSNLDNPLLRRLAVEAPGSYNHSVIVGTLAEAAAEGIGANALFCRVAAYYHDVGKMLKPGYFVENQREGINRHDRLSPHMSALVIASHVRDGAELARSYGLPQQVLDIIPQHHGTRKINYFYQKAKQSEKPELEEVFESDYRYPGPKPQTREAAIFMLADSIEAAARTLEDPSPARFKGLIKKIVSDVMLDDQFTECDLTFSDLEKVKATFLKTLCSIYHHRVDYPGFEFEKVTERRFRGSQTHESGAPRVRRWRQ